MSSEKSKKRFYIICAAATLVLLCLAFTVIMLVMAQRPVYVVDLNGVSVQTPAQAQIECRADYTRFEKISKQYDACSWVWCDTKLYLIRSSALRIDADAQESNFTAVIFRNSSGDKLSGYIIDPVTQPKELGRIELVDGEKYDFESVSMSVRVGLRDDEISYENAVYLWEKDSTLVLAVRPDTYETVQDNIVTFTDDGNAVHTCYILDTDID